MTRGREDSGASVEVHRYSGLGCLFAAGVLVSMGGGWLLDRWLGTLPLFLVVGALAGTILSTVSIYQKLLGTQESGARKSEDH